MRLADWAFCGDEEELAMQQLLVAMKEALQQAEANNIITKSNSNSISDSNGNSNASRSDDRGGQCEVLAICAALSGVDRAPDVASVHSFLAKTFNKTAPKKIVRFFLVSYLPQLASMLVDAFVYCS